MNDFLETRSQLFLLFKRRARTALMRAGLTAAYFPPHFRREEASAGHWGLTAEICREIVDVARERGTPTLVVLIPTSYQIDASIFQRYVRGFGEYVRYISGLPDSSA